MSLRNGIAFGAIIISGISFNSSKTAQAATQGNPVEVRVSKAAASEQYERDVDEAALASQEKAISRLTGLLKKYRNTPQEPTLLSKLAELQQQTSAILFRIGHGAANRSGKTIDLSRFRKANLQTIATLNDLIARYPSHEDIPHAYFLRGKSYEELGDEAAATKDYLHLVANFPNWDEVTSAYMSLADFAIEANDHPRAITYLKEVEKRPDDPHFPFALYKLAWSHYNLKKIPEALSYAERQIAYYNEKNKDRPHGNDPENLVTSDDALKENTLLDIAVFYFEGYEEKLPSYHLADAYPYFKKLEKGPNLGKMLSRFAKLLRSHEYEDDLVAWKDLVLQSESQRPECIDIVIVVYEHQLNLRRYAKLIETSKDLTKLYQINRNFDGWPRAHKLLLDTAEGLQTIIVKSKNQEGARGLSVTLAALYDAFTKIVDESDPRIPRVHYNLAETLFTTKDFAGATENYRWVVDHGSWNKVTKEASVPDASLKAIAARYEVLEQNSQIPKALSAKSLKEDKPDVKLNPMLAEWIDWVDTHVKHSKKDTDNFVFEASRSLYAAGRISEAVSRLQAFALANPSAALAIPSATLVVDTSIATANWEKTHELATDFMKVSAWKTTDFGKHLFAVAADASYKQIEARSHANDPKGTLDLADTFLKKYSTSERLADALTLAGAASLTLGDKPRAMGYFTRLIKESPKSASVTSAFLARAGIEEDRYQFAAAALDYRTYLQLPPEMLKIDPKTGDNLRKKVLVLSWLGGDLSDLKTVLDTKAICTESLIQECEKYSILVMLSSPEKSHDEAVTENAFDRARKSDAGEAKTLWAALALENTKSLAWRDRLIAVRALANGWDELDPLVKYTLIPYISQSIPKSFRLNRSAMGEIAPLRADERYITRRVEVIHEMENTATKVMKMPWARIRAESLNEIASLYIDLARGLSEVRAPKGLEGKELEVYQDTIRKLTVPFEEKGQDMRGKAFEIASRFGVENDSFAAISEPFFLENPSQAKALKPAGKLTQPGAIDLAFLDRVDAAGEWLELVAMKPEKVAEIKDPAKFVRTLWAQAVAHKRWPQVAFFMQEAHDKSLIPSGLMGAVKAVSLASAGAMGEALNELEDSRKSLEPKSRLIVAGTLLQHYSWTCNKDKAQALSKEINPEVAPVPGKASERKTASDAKAAAPVVAGVADAAKVAVR